MNCPMETGGNAEHLLDYVAGKLNAGERAQMTQHIEACEACRQLAGGQQAVWSALEDWEPAAVSLDFDRRLFQRIEQEPVSWWRRLSSQLSPIFRHAVPVAATAAVVLMAGLMMSRPSAPPQLPVEKSAQVEALPPDQLAHALDDMEMLRDLNHLVSADATEPKM